jgi:hypothetical protein
MTPKEKATQLCDAFYQKLPLERYVTTTDGDLSWEYNSWQRAKECALIAVDEMLNNAGFIWGGRDTETGLSARDSYRKYLQEVKQEIEKL